MKVLALRTRDGHYLEFSTIRANLEDGSDIVVDLSTAVFAEILEVAAPDPTDASPEATNGQRRRDRELLRISGAGGIQSQEDVKGLG